MIVEYELYFLIVVKKGYEFEVEEWVKRVFGDGVVKGIWRLEKEDLKMFNYFMGYCRIFLEFKFVNVNDLLVVWREILFLVEKNKKNMIMMDVYVEVVM